MNALDRKRSEGSDRSLRTTTNISSLDSEFTGLLQVYRLKSAETVQKESWLSLAVVLLERPLNGISLNNHDATRSFFSSAQLKHAENLIYDSYEVIRRTETLVRLPRFPLRKFSTGSVHASAVAPPAPASQHEIRTCHAHLLREESRPSRDKCRAPKSHKGARSDGTATARSSEPRR